MTPLDNNKKIINLNDLVAYTGLSKSCIYKKTMKREIPHMKIGKILFFQLDEIIAWISIHKVPLKEEIESDATKYLNRKM